MKTKNLFGETVELKDESPQALSPIQRHKKNVNYREGTKEKCCKLCAFCVQTRWGSKNFYKCEKIGYSNSEATDIRLKNVCDLFEREVKL